MKKKVKSRNQSNPPTRYIIGKTRDLPKIEYAISLKRSIADRINNSFITTYKPVLDDQPYRIFESMVLYRRWCLKSLPKWLGYGR